MKRPRGGSLFLLLEPDEFLARLATLVPPPRIHSVRYHGIFAPNSKARARVLPGSADAPEPIPSPPSSRPKAIPGTRTYRLPWADLLKKVFAVDVLACPDCGGRLQIIAFIADSVCDRLVHTAHKVKLSGESLRKVRANLTMNRKSAK